MSNMKLFVLSTTMMLLGIADSSARPVLYAWGGHFDHTNGGQAYVINPIEATVLALHGRGQSGGGDIGGPQHHAGFGYERKWFGGGPGGPGAGGVGGSGGAGPLGGGSGKSGGGNNASGGSGGPGSGEQSSGQGGGDGGNGGGGNGGGDGNGPNGPSAGIPEDPEPNNPYYPPWTPDELPTDPPEHDGSPVAGDGVPPPSSTAAVPEPGTLALFGIAFAALGARSRRRKS